MQFLWFLIIGAVAGWLAGLIMKGRGFGVLGNLVVGIVGAMLGGFLAGVIGLQSDGSLIARLAIALGGAIALLFVVGLIKKKA